ncbi:hypothetical protein HKK72_30355 [Actinomadura sp. HBU206391]|nr:hypothetical protein [Actinomadura sp. HBU206391]
MISPDGSGAAAADEDGRADGSGEEPPRRAKATTTIRPSETPAIPALAYVERRLRGI